MRAWATFMYRRRWLVIGLWLVAFVVLQVASAKAGKAYNDNFSLPNTDSTRAFEVLQKEFPSDSNSSFQIVFKAKEGTLTDATNSAQIAKTIADVKGVQHVVSVDNPLARKNAGQLSRDQRIGYANVVFDVDDNAIQDEISSVTTAVDKALAGESPTLQVEAGGNLVDQAQQGGGAGTPSEGIGFLAAAIILAITFGTLAATAVPLVTAAIALATGLAIDVLLSHTITIAQFTPQLATLIGLGVGIDYALFLVSRYRTELHKGATVEEAVVQAVNTSGRAVTFAGITVCIALLGMLVLGVSFLVGVAVATSIAVAVTMFASVTFLPAFLGVVGKHIDLAWLRRLPGDTGYRATLCESWLGGLRARRAGSIVAVVVVALLVVAGVASGKPSGALFPLVFIGIVEGWERLLRATRGRKAVVRTGPTRWEKWAGLIRRRPVLAVVSGLLIVTVLALPALAMRLGFSDAGTNNKDKTTRQAYDILGDGFGRGSNGPFLVTTKLAAPSDAASLVKLGAAMRATPGVAFVSPPAVNKDRTAAVTTLIPTTGPQDEATAKLLSNLRDHVVPTATAGTGLTTYIGGNTAGVADFSAVLGAKLPYFIGVVVLLSMLLLVIVFRSLVIPVKAALMNLLSIAAAFGIVTAVFQNGWGAGLINVSGTGPIEPFIPVLMFAILFGLSMDYEVFLVSRIHEEWVHTKDNTTAVFRGLGSTAGVITAAATIMIAVFGAFILLPDRIIKIFGVGLASAIFIDAFVIRTLLVPGIMFLCGKWNWWMPSWLERVVPKVSIEGDTPPDADSADDPEALAGARS